MHQRFHNLPMVFKRKNVLWWVTLTPTLGNLTSTGDLSLNLSSPRWCSVGSLSGSSCKKSAGKLQTWKRPDWVWVFHPLVSHVPPSGPEYKDCSGEEDTPAPCLALRLYDLWSSHLRSLKPFLWPVNITFIPVRGWIQPDFKGTICLYLLITGLSR